MVGVLRVDSFPGRRGKPLLGRSGPMGIGVSPERPALFSGPCPTDPLQIFLVSIVVRSPRSTLSRQPKESPVVPALCSPVRRPSAPEYRDAIKAAKLHPTDERILLQIAKGLWKTDSLERVLDDEWICKGARVSSSTFYRRLPALIAAGWVVKVGRRSGARRTNSLYRATIPQPVAPAAPPAPEPVELMDAIVVQLADVRAQMDVWTLPFAPVDASPAEWCWADPLDFYPALPARRSTCSVSSSRGLEVRGGESCSPSSRPCTTTLRRRHRRTGAATTGSPSWRRSALMRSGTAWTHRRPRAGGARRSRSSAVLGDDDEDVLPAQGGSAHHLRRS